jgi:hypothetical protein
MVKQEKGGKQCRIGIRFFENIEEIKNNRLKNGKSKDRVSSEKITNMIIRHLSWKDIFQDIVNCSDEEINQYGQK